jgi:hypothetical protein
MHTTYLHTYISLLCIVGRVRPNKIADLVGTNLWNCALHMLLRVVGDCMLKGVLQMFVDVGNSRYQQNLSLQADQRQKKSQRDYQQDQVDLFCSFLKEHCKSAGNISIAWSQEESNWTCRFIEGNKLLDFIAAPEEQWLAATEHLPNSLATVHVLKAFYVIYVEMLKWEISSNTIDRLEQEIHLMYHMASRGCEPNHGPRTTRDQREGEYVPPFYDILKNYAHIHMKHFIPQLRYFGTLSLCSMQLVEYANQRDHNYYNCTTKQTLRRCPEIMQVRLRERMTPGLCSETLFDCEACGMSFKLERTFNEHKQKYCSHLAPAVHLWPSQKPLAQDFLRKVDESKKKYSLLH